MILHRELGWVCLVGSLVASYGCASDAGSFGTGGQFSEGCSSHFNCAEHLLCITGACQSAFPRVYRFAFRLAELSKYKANGDSWDALGGAPDPRASLEVDGAVVCQTSTRSDTFDPIWNEACEVELFQTSSVLIGIWDMDVSEHDLIGAVNLGKPIEDLALKQEGFDFKGENNIKRLVVDITLK